MSKQQYVAGELEQVYLVESAKWEELCSRVQKQNQRLALMPGVDYGARLKSDKIVLESTQTEERCVYLNGEFWESDAAEEFKNLIIWPSRWNN